MTTDLDPDLLARVLNEMTYGHLERRFCSADAPMPEVDKDRYRWSHPDAVELDRQVPTANKVVVCRCPHCDLTFTTFPRPQ
jgi:hypothetical protein